MFGAQLARRLRHVDTFILNELKAANIKPLASPPSQIPAAVAVTNPFLPVKNERTGRWQGPKYSLRRQSDIIKGARLLGLDAVIPSGSKNPVAPITLKSNVKDEASSALLQRLRDHQSTTPTATADGQTQSTFPITWAGTPKEKESFGLYGKRRLMFKGHKWEKQVVLRRKLVAAVVEKIPETKKNLAWNRKKARRQPAKKLPF